MESTRTTTTTMQTLLLCSDAEFLNTLQSVLDERQVMPETASSSEAALEMVQRREYDVILVDWQEIGNPGDFLCGVRQSKAYADCVLVAIVADQLELRQACAAGVHFLIHKPASAVQIERCLRVAYCSTIARRRKRHREPVNIVASVRTRTQASAEAMVLNLSETGAGLRLQAAYESVGAYVGAGDEVELRFTLPNTQLTLQTRGRVVWATASHCGIRFTRMMESEQLVLEHWLTACVERSLADGRDRMSSACA